MARFVAGVALGLALGLVVSARADDQPDEVLAAATEAGVEPAQLRAALDTLAAADIPTDARSYLESTGELARPEPPPAPRFTPSFTPAGWPIGGALGARIFCIERYESTHGLRMWNPVAMPGSGGQHAQGWLGWLPSTAAQWGVRIGDRASEWRGAARILAQGERFARTQFFGVRAGLC